VKQKAKQNEKQSEGTRGQKNKTSNINSLTVLQVRSFVFWRNSSLCDKAQTNEDAVLLNC
jgi:hypothetical protein